MYCPKINFILLKYISAWGKLNDKLPESSRNAVCYFTIDPPECFAINFPEPAQFSLI